MSCGPSDRCPVVLWGNSGNDAQTLRHLQANAGQKTASPSLSNDKLYDTFQCSSNIYIYTTTSNLFRIAHDYMLLLFCYWAQGNTEYKFSVLTRDNADSSDSGTFLCRNARAPNDQDQIYINVLSQGTHLKQYYLISQF